MKTRTERCVIFAICVFIISLLTFKLFWYEWHWCYIMDVVFMLFSVVIASLIIRVWVKEAKNKKMREWQRRIRCINPYINQ